MDNGIILPLLFIALLGFIYLESRLFFKSVKFLIEKLVAIKTFAAGMPVQEIPVTQDDFTEPTFPDEDFGMGTFTNEGEFDEDLKPGDELEDNVIE